MRGGSSDVLFCDGHAKWMNPSVYHSNMDREDGAGYAILANAEPVDEATLRRYWDIRYEVD